MNLVKKEIHERALRFAKEFKRCEGNLIRILQEVDESKLYLDLSFTSLFQYAVKALELSEDVAYCFITVARKAKQVPELQNAIEDGSISVSKLKKAVSVITPENQAEWLDKLKTSTSKEIEREVARVNPKMAIPEKTKYVSENRLELKMGISQAIHDQLIRVQDLESKRMAKGASLEETLQALLQVYLEVKDPVKRAERVLKRAMAKPEKQLVSRRVASRRDGREPIPSATRHRIAIRDGGRCTHIEGVKRCENQRWTEAHHVLPVAQGGNNSFENLTTLCSTHHKLAHISAEIKVS
jgi:5-methylcytosine-specific restriction endonuclease McrA